MYPLYPMYSHSTVVQHESTSLVVLDDDGDFVVEGVAVWQVGGAGREEREKGDSSYADRLPDRVAYRQTYIHIQRHTTDTKTRRHTYR